MNRAIGYVKADNTPTDRNGNQFGNALSISKDGSTLAVAAPFEDSNYNGIINGPGGARQDVTLGSGNYGAVYVFTKDKSGNWSQQAYIKASNTGAGDEFGKALSLSGAGNILAVGAGNEASIARGIGGVQGYNSAQKAGAAYLY